MNDPINLDEFDGMTNEQVIEYLDKLDGACKNEAMTHTEYLKMLADNGDTKAMEDLAEKEQADD